MVCEIPPYSEQLKLFRLYKQSGDVAAYHKLIQANLRLAYKIADGFKNERFKEDLRSEAVIALAFAIERWDPERGVLTTIATPIIRQRLTRFLVENSYVSRIPYLTFKAYMEVGSEKDFSAITNARYLSNRESAENENGEYAVYRCPSVEEELEVTEEISDLFSKLGGVEEGYCTLFELIYGLNWKYDGKISLEQLSRMLRISKSRIKTKVNLVIEHVRSPATCHRCGNRFFRKSRRSLYCSECRSSSRLAPSPRR